MDRKKLFEYIITHNLKEDVKSIFGKQYNMVSINELTNYVQSHMAANKPESKEDNNSSSLDRKACFEIIKNNNWMSAIKDKYGKPYNSVPTDKLIQFINSRNSNSAVTETLKIEPEVKSNELTKSKTNIEKVIKVVIALCILLNRKDLATTLK